MPDQPTLGEVARRLQDTVDQVKALAERLDRDREAHERAYIPRELYAAMHQADNAVVADLASDIRSCRDSTLVEIQRVETKLDTFNAEYDSDRQRDRDQHAEDVRAEKSRKQTFTLTVVCFAVGQLVTVVLALLALINGR